VYSGKTPVDGHKNLPKHVEFYFKNKFEKFVHLVGFVTEKEPATIKNLHIFLNNVGPVL
jgi:hypothetical protein